MDTCKARLLVHGHIIVSIDDALEPACENAVARPVLTIFKDAN